MADKPTKVFEPRTIEQTLNAPIDDKYSELIEKEFAAAARLSDRNRVQDIGVGILDTISSIGTIPLAALPGIGLEQSAKNSAYLDRFRSPAYLQEREDDARSTAAVTAESGELAGLAEAVLNTFQGGNLVPDASAQIPYLGIGTVARALGVTATEAVPGVLGRSLAAIGGNSQPAVINRIAALSGILEGAGGYAQTYERAIRDGLSPEQAAEQARVTGAASAVAGFALGKLTPGFELDPLGRRTSVTGTLLEDVLRPSVSSVAGEITEETGIAITNTVVDNILAGKKPTEGLGGAVGEAAALAGAFSGTLRTPGAIRDASLAVGKGVVEGISSGVALGAKKLSNRAVTPQDASVNAAQAALKRQKLREERRNRRAQLEAEDRAEVIQSTGSVDDTASRVDAEANTETSSEGGTTSEEIIAASNVDKIIDEKVKQPLDSKQDESEKIEEISQTEPETTGNSLVEVTKENIQTLPVANSGSPAVDAILTAAALTDRVVTASSLEEKAAAAEDLSAFQEVAELDTATTVIEDIKDSTLNTHIEQAKKGNVQSQQIVEAVASTDITRLPAEQVPERERPLHAAMQELRNAAALDKTSQEILETGFGGELGKQSKKRQGILNYVQAIMNVGRRVGDVPQVEMARRLAVFVDQIQKRAALFEAALERANNPTDEDRAQGHVLVEGSETLDEDGRIVSKPFKIWLNSAKSKEAARRPIQDAQLARKIYDLLKTTYPTMINDAEQQAAVEIERVELRRALRIASAEADATLDQNEAKTEEKKDEKPAVVEIDAGSAKAATETVKQISARGFRTAKANGSIVTVPADQAEATRTILAAVQKALDAKAAKVATSEKKEEPKKEEPKKKEPEKTEVKKEEPKTDELSDQDREDIINESMEITGIHNLDDLQNYGKILKTKKLSNKARELIRGLWARRRLQLQNRAKADPNAPVVTFKNVTEFFDAIWDGTYLVNNAQIQGLIDWWNGISEETAKKYHAAYVKKRNLSEAEDEYLFSLLNDTTLIEEDAEDATTSEENTSEEDASETPTSSTSESTTAVTAKPDEVIDYVNETAITDGVVRNPLVKRAIDWVTGKFNQVFNLDPSVSLEHFLSQLSEADRNIVLADRKEILEQLKGKGKNPGLLVKGIANLYASPEATAVEQIHNKPFGIASVLWERRINEDGSSTEVVPDEVAEAFATAAVLHMYRAGARYLRPLNDETQEIVRDAYPTAWAQEIARDALLFLGMKGKRSASMTYTEGVPLTYGLAAVQALVNTNNFVIQTDGNNNPVLSDKGELKLPTMQGLGDTHATQVLIPRPEVIKAAKARGPVLQRAMKIIKGPRIYSGDTVPSENIPDTVQFSPVRLSERYKTALRNLNNTPHTRNAQLSQLRKVLGNDLMVKLFTGYYKDDVEDGLPFHVKDYLESIQFEWGQQLEAADYYDSLLEDDKQPIYFEYGVGRNGRTVSKFGPQGQKLIRDLFSSAYEQLDLRATVPYDGGELTHRQLLEIALAQSLSNGDIKTDTNSPEEILAAWAALLPTVKDKALRLQELLNSDDPSAPQQILDLLGQSTPQSPRYLNGLLTLGRLLNHTDDSQPFENYLPFEIDGKTNGAFNVEMFFGLGTISKINLEQAGLFLGKDGTTWAKERDRVGKVGKDLYTRIARVAKELYDKILEERIEKSDYPTTQREEIEREKKLLSLAGLLDIGKDGSLSMTRAAGKVAIIPVQYGGSLASIQSQLWAEMRANLIKDYIRIRTEFSQLDRKAYPEKAAALKAQLENIRDNLEGSETLIRNPDAVHSEAEALWYYSTRSMAKALYKAYEETKPVAVKVTQNLLQISHVAYAVKTVQFKLQHLLSLPNLAENKNLESLFGKKTANGRTITGFALSRSEYDRILDGTVDASFSTAAGKGMVSLNHTEFDQNTFRLTGLGTNLTGNLNLPVPAAPGVRVLALLTLAGGDASMGVLFNQEQRNITDVYDGIEFLISRFMTDSEALNKAVWDAATFDIMRDFFRVLEDMQAFLAKLEEAQGQIDPQILQLQTEIISAFNSTKLSKEDRIGSWQEFRKTFALMKRDFNKLYNEQRAGQARLLSESHTLAHMGGGTTYQTPKATDNDVREAIELSLVEDNAPPVNVLDLSDTGQREEGLYPNQYRNPTSTRYEDTEGLLDVDETGNRHTITNTWNSPGAVRGAGFRRLVRAIQRAMDANKPLDSDSSVNPAAMRMYLRAIDAGMLMADFDRPAVEAALENNTVLRREGGVFQNIQLTPRAMEMVSSIDPTLRTSFDLLRNGLNREQVIDTLDKVKWKNPIYAAVWKRLRNILPPEVKVLFATNRETWEAAVSALDIKRRYGTVTAVARGSNVVMSKPTAEIMLHELMHVVFTQHIINYFNNINAVPAELRGPINDLVQLMVRFKKLPKVGTIGFVQNVMERLELAGDQAAALDEMLAYTLTQKEVIEELSPGFVQRVINKVKEIISRIFKTNSVPPSILDEMLGVFERMADVVPHDRENIPNSYEGINRYHQLNDLEQLTEQAFDSLNQRIGWGRVFNLATVMSESMRPRIETKYNLDIDQQLMFDRVYMLLRAADRSPDVDAFVSAVLPKHFNRDLFNGSKDVAASVLALAAVEPTFRAQLDKLWGDKATGESTVKTLIDKGLNAEQNLSSEKLLTSTMQALMLDKELNSSFLGTAVGRLDRLGRTVLTKLGAKAKDLATEAPEGVNALLAGVHALTTEEGARAFGNGLLARVNSVPNSRWAQDLAATLLGTQEDGKLIYRAHSAMLAAISGTRAVFDTILPKTLKEDLFPQDFNGWAPLYESFGKIDAASLGSFAREMYLNDAERQRMIRVLSSLIPNAIDAQNLGYYLVHRRPRPGSAQKLLRNARAIADNINNQRQVATEELVEQVDKLITLYAIEALPASERARIAEIYRAHPGSMEKLIGLMGKLKKEALKDQRPQYRYIYWKDYLPVSMDPRGSVVLANSVKGAALEKLGYRKGPKYPRTPGDPSNDIHYYIRDHAPTPTFSQGIINTVQETAQGINYTTAATINPTVGTIIKAEDSVAYIGRNQGVNSTLIPIYAFTGEILGYERMLDPDIVAKHLKTGNTQLHLSIGKAFGRITEERMAKVFNQQAIKLMVDDWANAQQNGLTDQYEQVNSTTDKQVARAWEVVPKDMKNALTAAFPDGKVMVRRHLIANTLGYYKAGLLEVFTGDATLNEETRRAAIGLAQFVLGPNGAQRLLRAELALKEGVSFAKDMIIVRSLSVPYNNFMASINQVIANGVPITKVIKRYQQGIRELRAYNRLQREVIRLTIQIANAADPIELARLKTVQQGKLKAQQRLSIYPLIKAGDLTDLPEGLEEAPSHSYIGDIAGWLDNHLRTVIHPKAPKALANILFAKDSAMHDALSKSIQAGDFLARYTIYMHLVETGVDENQAKDIVRDELVAYQTNPGRMRAALEDYGMLWWSQFTLRTQAVLLRRIRQNPLSFMVAQGIGETMGNDGPADQALWERGVDNSLGIDQMFGAHSAYFWSKMF